MDEPIVKQFKTSEEVRIRNRQALKKLREKYKHDPVFRARKASHASRRYYRLKEAGLCASCGKNPSNGSAHCEDCRDNIKRLTTEWKQKMVDAGLCNRCGKAPCLPAMKGRRDSFCEPCYFKKTSTDCLRTAKHAILIGEKLKAQNYRCAYTNELIVLGLNDSLDHVLPISRFPELRSDPANVEWVTRKVNCMKWDSTREEFLETARLVVANAHRN